MRFQTTHAPPGDTLVHAGDLISALYFISRGCIEILKGDMVIAILGKNDTFGEPINLHVLPGKSCADVRALTYCDLHKICREDMLEVLKMYPEFSDYFWSNLEITFNLRELNNEAAVFLRGEASDYEGFSRPKRKHRLPSTHTGDNMSATQRDTFKCRVRHGYWEKHDGHNKVEHKHTLEDEVEDLKVTSPAHSSMTNAAANNIKGGLETDRRENSCNPLTDAFTGASNVFAFWGSENREEQNYQEVPTCYSLPSSLLQPPTEKLPDLPHFSCSPSKQKVALENRLDALQQQITRFESSMSADIRTIMQALQRQIPMIPPSYSTLTSTCNPPNSTMLFPIATSPTHKSTTTHLQQEWSNKKQVLPQFPDSLP